MCELFALNYEICYCSTHIFFSVLSRYFPVANPSAAEKKKTRQYVYLYTS